MSAFKVKLEKLEALRRGATSESLDADLRKALSDRNNYIIAKAAAVVAERNVLSLIPDLMASYDRLFDPAPTVDPLATGKQAIAQALKDLGHADASLFLRGLHHVQLEPAWGKPVDAAAGLRVICAHALVACDIDTFALLEHFTDLLADPEKIVRLEVVRAIGEIGSEGILLLRLKALCSDPEPEVIGECFLALLRRQRGEGVTFVARFLRGGPFDFARCARYAQGDITNIQFEAASALASSRESEALEIVKQFWLTNISQDLRRAIVFSLGDSPVPEAADFLLSLVSDRRDGVAAAAVEALGSSRFKDTAREPTLRAVEKLSDPQLERVFAKAFA
jgi:HEAT repeat protein